MAWLLQGPLPLLLLALTAAASADSLKTKYEGAFANFTKITSIDGLINYDGNMTIAFINEVLVTKYCFRDWMDDKECDMHAYEEEAKEDADAARDKHPKGHDAHKRIGEQLKTIVDHEKGLKSSGGAQKFMNKLGKALKFNLKEMISELVGEHLNALNKHLNSSEFDDMYNNIKEEVLKPGKSNEAGIKHEVARMMYNAWVEDEKKKSEGGEITNKDDKAHVRGTEEWNKLMNKMPDTKKYNTRGSTPIVKKHLAKDLDALNYDAYTKLKKKSQEYLLSVAQRLRHEAMQKSNSIISYVMHKMQGDGSDHDMKEMQKFLNGQNKEMNHKGH